MTQLLEQLTLGFFVYFTELTFYFIYIGPLSKPAAKSIVPNTAPEVIVLNSSPYKMAP
jgi:hypothetical protein